MNKLYHPLRFIYIDFLDLQTFVVTQQILLPFKQYHIDNRVHLYLQHIDIWHAYDRPAYPYDFGVL